MGLDDIFIFYVINIEKNIHNPTIFLRISTGTESKSMKFESQEGSMGLDCL
jgi:hypothetical protein